MWIGPGYTESSYWIKVDTWSGWTVVIGHHINHVLISRSSGLFNFSERKIPKFHVCTLGLYPSVCVFNAQCCASRMLIISAVVISHKKQLESRVLAPHSPDPSPLSTQFPQAALPNNTSHVTYRATPYRYFFPDLQFPLTLSNRVLYFVARVFASRFSLFSMCLPLSRYWFSLISHGLLVRWRRTDLVFQSRNSATCQLPSSH